MTDNPYLRAATEISATVDTEAEEIRRAHLGRESNIRAFGGLMYFQAIFPVLAGLIWFVMSLAFLAGFDLGLADPEVEAQAPSIFSAILLLLLSAAAIVFGVWVWRSGEDLRRLSRSGRPAGWVMGVLSLLNPPIGTLLGIGMLYCLLGRKAQFVLSPEYREIVAQTPQIKAQWSIITKVLIGILAFVLILGIVAMLAVLITEGPEGFSQPSRR